MISSIRRSPVRRALSSVILGAVALLAACGGGGGSSEPSTGTLQMSMTDAPACGYDKVWIDVQKLRIHQSADAADGDAGWTDMAVNSRVDLLSLTNGVLQTLGQVPLQAGHYQQLRLVLGTNNSALPSGGTETALTVPSGLQSGIKIPADILIEAGKMADFVLDFDACRSVVKAGASGKIQLKPVIAATPHYLSGVSGHVDPSLVQPTTVVSVGQAGVLVKSAVPLADGQFVLPVPPGSYDLVVTSANHATAVVTGVVVTTDTVTALDGATLAFNPPASAMGTLAGTVTTAVSPIDATVQVTQTLAGGSKVAVASAPVDAATGAYVFAVPTAAPVVAAYAPAPASLTFAADGTAAGKYTVSATSAGVAKPGVAVTLAAGATVTTGFSFP